MSVGNQTFDSIEEPLGPVTEIPVGFFQDPPGWQDLSNWSFTSQPNQKDQLSFGDTPLELPQSNTVRHDSEKTAVSILPVNALAPDIPALRFK
ncbi:hypothetical protein CQ011_17555 [Arthrobacter sp. MYb213]|nr:hypothetical protein CQ011_17555 [Arthrobacter sp. MYb213]